MFLDWPQCRNSRDLGGLTTGSGARLRPGALIRSDNLSRLTPAGVAVVRAAGVSRIVDLRSPAECQYDPSPFADEPLYRNCPLSQPEDSYDLSLPLDLDYAAMLDRRPELFAAAVATVADAPPGAVVVHCHAGKDRSGLVTALLLGLVGVPVSGIAADYAAISAAQRVAFAEQLDRIADPAEREQLAGSFQARPETMRSVLELVERRHGGVAAYLAVGGLSGSQARAVRTRLLAVD